MLSKIDMTREAETMSVIGGRAASALTCMVRPLIVAKKTKIQTRFKHKITGKKILMLKIAISSRTKLTANKINAQPSRRTAGLTGSTASGPGSPEKSSAG